MTTVTRNSLTRIGSRIARSTNRLRFGTAPKVFCIGRNKTGTTSLGQALKDFGFVLGNQTEAELLIHDYAQRNFEPIAAYCLGAQAFQDFPFSLPYTYIAMDYAFPGSKFILSVRKNEEEWYRSLVQFHGKRYGIEGIPSKENLQNDTYKYKGWMWQANRIIYNTPEDDPFNEQMLKEHYLRHNEDVVRYFRHRTDLLVLNLAEKDSYPKLCHFLDQEPQYAEFPWLKKTADWH